MQLRIRVVTTAIKSAPDRTSFVKPADVAPKWFVVDAEGQIVGRLATQIATVLMGKHKPEYTPHVDTGDYVIVLNAGKVQFTGGGMVHPEHPAFTTKMAKKKYWWVTGWPSGLRNIPAINLWEKKPEEILRLAVKRMLPKTALGRHMLDKLKLVEGDVHPHQAQKPEAFPPHLMPAKVVS
ncbi:50S ribosomal protein L13 [Planctopirus hydrillae]|uniref:Large ribosomal subunit protein uL13 n=1 Tax=Planctopirus hydrillae TaxID=1841610 RepID=A0A1C3EAC2_9PLAN|nr:50S ribosomal protein L13 [Planctopirus hydrillae]